MTTSARIFAASDATWPAATLRDVGPVTLREGQGGGSRASAATVRPGTSADEITAHLPAAEAAMLAMGQSCLFQVREGDDALDALLAVRGYAVMDPVVAFSAPVAALTARPLEMLRTFCAWPAIAAQAEIWAAGGIGPARRAVMARARTPRTTLLGRAGDSPAATAFVACDGPLAMLHALEVAPPFRRSGLGRDMMHAAGHWAAGQGARDLALLVTRANGAACALYAGIGMRIVTHYHYRILRTR